MYRGRVIPSIFDLDLSLTFKYAYVYDLLEMKNMIPAAKERLNLSKAEKWANERMPAMMPAKHAIPERIMNARVAFQYAEERDKKCSQNNPKEGYHPPIIIPPKIPTNSCHCLFDFSHLIFKKLSLRNHLERPTVQLL